MKIKNTILLFAAIIMTSNIVAQQQPYTITRAPFSTDMYDEFAPAYYKNGLVFCSDRGQAVNSQGQRVIKMYYADTNSGKKSVEAFVKGSEDEVERRSGFIQQEL